MPLVLVHRDFIGRYPPEPYLISSQDEIDEGEAEAAKFHEAWLDKHPFPGVHSTWQAKYDWLKALQKEYMDEFEKSIFTNPPEVWQIASEILLDEAPETILVQFYAKRDELEAIKLYDDAAKSRFATGIEEYGRNEFLSSKSERSWEAYKAWLLENKNDHDGEVLLGSVECFKEEQFQEVFRCFTRELGMFISADSVQQLKSTFRACSDWGLMDEVGSNLYSPLADDNTTLSFNVLVRFSTKTPEEMAKYEFLSRLEDMTEETENAERFPLFGKYYMFVSKETAVSVVDSDGEEHIPISPDNHYVLWLSRFYKEMMEEVRSHFAWGKGESRDIQRRLFKGNTDTGNLKMDIFSAEFEALKEERCWGTKFARAFALTRIAAYDTYWMQDNEFPEEIANMVTKLGDYWRNNLLKKDDETLGIGLDLEKENGDSSEMSESRKALICLLRRLGKQFEEASEYCKVKFNVVGRPRKKKASNAQNKRHKLEIIK